MQASTSSFNPAWFELVRTNSFALRTAGTITGGVTLGGNVGATGVNAQAANLGGDIGGQLLINGSIDTRYVESILAAAEPLGVGDLERRVLRK